MVIRKNARNTVQQHLVFSSVKMMNFISLKLNGHGSQVFYPWFFMNFSWIFIGKWICFWLCLQARGESLLLESLCAKSIFAWILIEFLSRLFDAPAESMPELFMQWSRYCKSLCENQIIPQKNREEREWNNAWDRYFYKHCHENSRHLEDCWNL